MLSFSVQKCHNVAWNDFCIQLSKRPQTFSLRTVALKKPNKPKPKPKPLNKEDPKQPTAFYSLSSNWTSAKKLRYTLLLGHLLCYILIPKKASIWEFQVLAFFNYASVQYNMKLQGIMKAYGRLLAQFS